VIIEGRALKYRDNINTDEIIPARYLTTTDPKELSKHCMEGIDPEFLGKLREKKILVVGRNFGCGSSREHAPLALKASGVRCIIGISFARIFFRNSINIGLPVLESAKAFLATHEGDELRVDIEQGKVANLTKGETYAIARFPYFLQEIVKKGGLGGYIKAKGELI
jgi:3-isopropylmalate/(R)-2-methylmalate dehydratase small subunit